MRIENNVLLIKYFTAVSKYGTKRLIHHKSVTETKMHLQLMVKY